MTLARRLKSNFKAILTILVIFLVSMQPAGAIQSEREEILKITDTIEERKTKLSELQTQIETYKRKISQEQTKQITFQNQMALLDNRIAKTELDIEAKELEVENVSAEIEIKNQEIAILEARIENQKIILKDLLQEIYNNDQKNELELLVTVNKFSDFYTQVKFVEDVQQNLQKTLEEVSATKSDQELLRNQLEDRRLAIENLRQELEKTKVQLEEERGAKEYLVASSAASEIKFQQLLSSLRAESQYIDSQISSLEDEMAQKLKQIDTSQDSGGLLSWPVENPGIITATFHDPDYPFRYLFEHSGVDLQARKGTPVKSMAPGIVAVARTGNLYGNYVIVIHANGISTLYAHLSRILVKPEQYVERGESVGLSGGVKGDPGAGLSTGAHLHFEVRSNGIPVDPIDYLISR